MPLELLLLFLLLQALLKIKLREIVSKPGEYGLLVQFGGTLEPQFLNMRGSLISRTGRVPTSP
jgi:hypothetical protein